MAVTVSELLVKVEGDTRDAERKLVSLQDRLASIPRAANNFGRSFAGALGTVGKLSLGIAGATLALGAFNRVAGAVSSLPGLVEAAARSAGAKEALQGLAAGVGETADSIIESVKRASANTINESQIIQNSVQALSLIGGGAFTNFSEQFSEATDLIRRAARATGQDVAFLQESFVKGIGRGSKLILDNLGITVDVTAAQERYAASLGKTREELTPTEQKAALLNATLDHLRATYANVAASAGGLTQSLAQLRTNVSNLTGQFASLFVPIANKLVQAINMVVERFGPPLIAFVENLLINWINAFAGMELQTARSIGRIAGFLFALGKNVVQFGMNIVSSLATGITSALGLVAQAVQAIGRIIGFWLAPGSPPRILPDLNTWGRETANEWLSSWLEADFGILRGVSQEIKPLLEDIARADLVLGFEQQDVIPTMQAIRQETAMLIDEFRQTGTVSEEAFGRLRDAAGPAADEVEGLTRRYVELEKSQARVNEITKEYEKALGPLNKQLEAVQRQQAAIASGRRIRELQNALRLGTLGAEDRAEIVTRIQEEELKQRIAGIKAARDEELGAAEAARDEAQRSLDVFKERLSIQRETNALQEEQLSLLERLDKIAGGIGKKVKDGLAGIADEITGQLANIEPPELTGIAAALESDELLNVFNVMKTGFEEGQLAFENMKKQFNTEGFSGLFETLKRVRDDVDKTTQTLTTFDQELDNVNAPPPGDQTFVGRMQAELEKFRKFIDEFEMPTLNFSDFVDIGADLNQLGVKLTEGLANAINAIDWGQVGRWFGEAIVGMIKGIIGLAAALTGLIFGAWRDTVKNEQAIKKGNDQLGEAIKKMVTSFAAGFWTAIGRDLVDPMIDGMLGIFGLKATRDKVTNKIKSVIRFSAGDSVETVEAEGMGIGSSFMDGISRGIDGAIDSVKRRVDSFVENLPGWVKGPLGITNPSKVFIAIGTSIMDGLARGIKNNIRMVEREASKIADSLIESVGDGSKDLAKDFGKENKRITKDVKSLAKEFGKWGDRTDEQLDETKEGLEGLREKWQREFNREIPRILEDMLFDLDTWRRDTQELLVSAGDAITGISTAFDGLATAVGNSATDIGSSIDDIISDIGRLADTEGVVNRLRETIEGIAGQTITIQGNIETSIRVARDDLTPIIGQLLTDIEGLLGMVREAAGTAGQITIPPALAQVRDNLLARFDTVDGSLRTLNGLNEAQSRALARIEDELGTLPTPTILGGGAGGLLTTSPLIPAVVGAGDSGSITVNINDPVISNELDIEQMALRIAEVIADRNR